MNEPRSAFTEPPAARDRWILAASALLALVPLAAYHGMFARLYWFGDEFDLIDQFDRMGFWHWIWIVFAENFVPLFKLLWGGCVLLFHGSYAAMIVILWLTHALNVALLGRVMRTCGISWGAVAFAQIAFGLSCVNVETLVWSVQWSAVLSAGFMLLALDSFFRSPFRPASFAWVIASALTFSRGVLTGAVLARASLWPEAGGTLRRHLRRAVYALIYLVPAVVTGWFIAVNAVNYHDRMTGHLGEAAIYAAWYYCLNPAYRLLSVESWGWHTVIVLGLCKFALIAWVLLRSAGRPRLLFVLLVGFDMGNALLLGFGRYHTGLLTTTSSRYQYASLIGIAPLGGFWLSRLWGRIPAPPAVRAAAAAALLGAYALLACLDWRDDLDHFTSWRGTDSRRLLLVEPNPDPYSVPGIPFLEVKRARALIAKYNLH